MPGSYVVAASAGVHSLASASSVRSAGTAAYVIEIGQPWPGSVCDQAMKPAARRTWACAESDSQGAAWRPCPTARPISQCHDGWNRDLVDAVAVAVVVVSSGLCVLASLPCSRASAVPASAPSGDQVVDDLGGPCRVTASTERQIGGHHVVTDQRRRLVVGGCCRCRLLVMGQR